MPAAFVPLSGLRFQIWRARIERSTQHLLRLWLRSAECERVGARGLETQSCPHTGLFMTSDVAEAHPLSPGSGEGPRQTGPRNGRGEVRGASHQTQRAAGPVVPDDAERCACTDRAPSPV